VAEEGRLGKDLEVHERRRRLKGNRRQLLEPVQVAGRVDVAQGDGEDQSPGQRSQPSFVRVPASDWPAPHDVIAMIDGLQERLQMSLGPRLLGRRDQNKRKPSASQTLAQRLGEPLVVDRDDPGFDRAIHRGQLIGHRRDDGLGVVDRQVGEEDDANTGVGQRIALKVAEEGIVEFLACGHSCSMRR
jgi:hypothetical protein